MNTTNYSILVLSCDGYADIWDTFAQSFDKFWADCPFNIYLCSEEKKFVHPRIKNIRIGRKAPWGTMLSEVLAAVNTKYIIYMQEDYILKGPSRTNKIIELLTIFEKENAALQNSG